MIYLPKILCLRKSEFFLYWYCLQLHRVRFICIYRPFFFFFKTISVLCSSYYNVSYFSGIAFFLICLFDISEWILARQEAWKKRWQVPRIRYVQRMEKNSFFPFLLLCCAPLPEHWLSLLDCRLNGLIWTSGPHLKSSAKFMGYLA